MVKFSETPAGKALTRFESLRASYSSKPFRHSLPKSLYVNITSYPPRFKTLVLTLISLTNQSVVPDGIILWIAHDDKDHLPIIPEVLSQKITIEFCEDVKSYKKLIPAIRAMPDAYHVTADDDVYYHHRWLEDLVTGALAIPLSTAYHFGFKIGWSGDKLLTYGAWTPDVSPSKSGKTKYDVLPIGVGGVIYPPNCFHPDVTDQSIFLNVAPYSDDIWFYVMTRLMGFSQQKVGDPFIQIPWPDTQNHALWSSLAVLRNDQAIAEMAKRYGESVFKLR